MYNKNMRRGRPTNEPKGVLVAVRLSKLQHHALLQRARMEDTSVSEALRRCVIEWSRGTQRVPTREPTKAERETLIQLAQAFGATPKRRTTNPSTRSSR
jgi:hypothetical protein